MFYNIVRIPQKILRREKMKRLQRIAALVLALIMCLSLCACGGDDSDKGKKDKEDDVKKSVLSTDTVSIDAVCVDNSYTDDDGAPLKMLYVFFTVSAEEENFKVDSKYIDLTIDGKNTYTCEHYPSSAAAAEYTTNYYYSSYIEDVYMGTSLKVLATFEVPEAELEAGREMTFSDSSLPDFADILIYTDDIVFYDSPEDIGKELDPEGYEEYNRLREEANPETAATIRSLINGYYWKCYVNSTWYEVEFYAENNFEMRAQIGSATTSNVGTYSVRNGYIFCTYESNGHTIEIPYEVIDGDVKMTLSDAFDVMG